MGFDTLIVNGRVATATDTYTRRCRHQRWQDFRAWTEVFPRENATKIIDAAGKVRPSRRYRRAHASRYALRRDYERRRFRDGHATAALAARRLWSTSPSRQRATLRTAFDAWMQKASGKAVCDYAFHCIITELADAQLDEMNALTREGVTSFKLFMAYPGVFMLDDASIFKAFRATSKNGGLVCMHAENGSAIDVIVQQALAEGKKAPKYHALTRPTTAEAEAVFASDCAGGNGRSASLHRPLELQ